MVSTISLLAPLEGQTDQHLGSVGSASLMTSPQRNPLLVPSHASRSTESPPPAPSSPSLSDLLGKILSIKLRDGRIVIGYLLCVDQGMNIILRDAEEFRSPFPPSITSQAEYEALSEGERTRWEKVRENREAYWPKSEPFGGWGTGWGGRGMGMVGVKKDDVVKIEVEAELWRAIGGEVDKSEAVFEKVS